MEQKQHTREKKIEKLREWMSSFHGINDEDGNLQYQAYLALLQKLLKGEAK